MATVKDILREIDSLDAEQRLQLERELAARARVEWAEETAEAREAAARRGIDQATIDQALQRRRYGR